MNFNFPDLKFGLLYVTQGGSEGSFENYEGDFTDTDAIVDFLSSDDALQLPDRIEDVSPSQLDKLVQDKTFVAAIFCKLSTIVTVLLQLYMTKA